MDTSDVRNIGHRQTTVEGIPNVYRNKGKYLAAAGL